MEEIRDQRLTGERALFMKKDILVEDSIFADGESPLKEGKNIKVKNSSFQWKYPLWYCSNVEVSDCSFFEMARAGIWYTNNITLNKCLYQAPKGFRRVDGLVLDDVDMPNALETLWQCKNAKLLNCSVKGDYFAMNCENLYIDSLNLCGNYSFDGCRNVEVHNSKLLTKDAFWNCENVTVYDSYISGEYTGWNSSNVTFVNCTLESLQGFCYMKNVKLVNCKVMNTNLAFEYSTVDAEITTSIDSVKNPLGGKITCRGIKEIIFDDSNVDRNATEIICTDGTKVEQ